MAFNYYNDGQCTHIIMKNKEVYAQEIMDNLLHLGADINGQEASGDLTPLDSCVQKMNYKLAGRLCNAPGIDLEATSFKGQTAYQLAFERDDHRLMEIANTTGAMYQRPRGDDYDSGYESS